MGVHAIYFHGFASGPNSKKGELLEGFVSDQVDAFHRPDLNGDDFSSLTMDRWFASARASIQEIPTDDKLLLCGSSLGAYTAAVLAAECDVQRVALLLIAPAFGINKRWSHILGGDQALSHWRDSGQIDFFHYAYEREMSLRYAFYESCLDLADYPSNVQCPGSIIHGVQDQVVDINMVEAFADRHPHMQCYFLNDEHALLSDHAQDCMRREALGLVNALR